MKRDRKNAVIKTLEKIPIIKHACEKNGISRQTFYRWYGEDPFFYEQVEMAMMTGEHEVNDIAEIGLLKSIEAGEIATIKWWLSRRNSNYKDGGKAPMDRYIELERKRDDLEKEKEEYVDRKAEELLAEKRKKLLNEAEANKNEDS